MLKSSGISKDEVLENHEDVLNLLEFQDNFNNQTLTQLQPTALPDEIEISLDDLVNPSNPNDVFKDLVKIGEG